MIFAFNEYQPLGATLVQACNICDFPKPGSPTINTCERERTFEFSEDSSFFAPPNRANSKPAFTISLP